MVKNKPHRRPSEKRNTSLNGRDHRLDPSSSSRPNFDRGRPPGLRLEAQAACFEAFAGHKLGVAPGSTRRPDVPING